jgi:hypothetical protein
MKYINAYSVTRHYGGPEEGGWWYDAGMPIASTEMPDDATDEQIADEKARLAAQLGWKSKRDRHSAVPDPGEDFEIYVQDHPADEYPQGRPQYE